MLSNVLIGFQSICISGAYKTFFNVGNLLASLRHGKTVFCYARKIMTSYS